MQKLNQMGSGRLRGGTFRGRNRQRGKSQGGGNIFKKAIGALFV